MYIDQQRTPPSEKKETNTAWQTPIQYRIYPLTFSRFIAVVLCYNIGLVIVIDVRTNVWMFSLAQISIDIGQTTDSFGNLKTVYFIQSFSDLSSFNRGLVHTVCSRGSPRWLALWSWNFLFFPPFLHVRILSISFPQIYFSLSLPISASLAVPWIVWS